LDKEPTDKIVPLCTRIGSVPRRVQQTNSGWLSCRLFPYADDHLLHAGFIAFTFADGFEFAVPFTDTSKILPESLAGKDVRVIREPSPMGTLPASETGELDDG